MCCLCNANYSVLVKSRHRKRRRKHTHISGANAKEQAVLHLKALALEYEQAIKANGDDHFERQQQQQLGSKADFPTWDSLTTALNALPRETKPANPSLLSGSSFIEFILASTKKLEELSSSSSLSPIIGGGGGGSSLVPTVRSKLPNQSAIHSLSSVSQQSKQHKEQQRATSNVNHPMAYYLEDYKHLF